jgi:hypothetical protein
VTYAAAAAPTSLCCHQTASSPQLVLLWANKLGALLTLLADY